MGWHRFGLHARLQLNVGAPVSVNACGWLMRHRWRLTAAAPPAQQCQQEDECEKAADDTDSQKLRPE